jgi:hypothetical protein
MRSWRDLLLDVLACLAGLAIATAVTWFIGSSLETWINAPIYQVVAAWAGPQAGLGIAAVAMLTRRLDFAARSIGAGSWFVLPWHGALWTLLITGNASRTSHVLGLALAGLSSGWAVAALIDLVLGVRRRAVSTWRASGDLAALLFSFPTLALVLWALISA